MHRHHSCEALKQIENDCEVSVHEYCKSSKMFRLAVKLNLSAAEQAAKRKNAARLRMMRLMRKVGAV